jgi:hypothetical protein
VDPNAPTVDPSLTVEPTLTETPTEEPALLAAAAAAEITGGATFGPDENICQFSAGPYTAYVEVHLEGLDTARLKG